MAEKLKEQRKNLCFAILRNCSVSPKKLRRIINLIRNKDVEHALHLLTLSRYGGTEYIRKLLLSAIANWKQKNEGKRVEEAQLYIKLAYVNQARSLKRIRHAPHGRAHRMLRRSSHVAIFLDSKQVNTIQN